jgi:hypothetical protein
MVAGGEERRLGKWSWAAVAVAVGLDPAKLPSPLDPAETQRRSTMEPARPASSWPPSPSPSCRPTLRKSDVLLVALFSHWAPFSKEKRSQVSFVYHVFGVTFLCVYISLMLLLPSNQLCEIQIDNSVN